MLVIKQKKGKKSQISVLLCSQNRTKENNFYGNLDADYTTTTVVRCIDTKGKRKSKSVDANEVETRWGEWRNNVRWVAEKRRSDIKEEGSLRAERSHRWREDNAAIIRWMGGGERGMFCKGRKTKLIEVISLESDGENEAGAGGRIKRGTPRASATVIMVTNR